MLLESKLQKMKGKTFLHKTITKKIIDYKITEEEVLISTDVNLISIKIETAEEALKEFLPAESENPKGIMQLPHDKRWSNLKDAAYSMIDKLQTEGGEKHIPRANAINQTIGSIVGLMKVEIEAIKLTHK